MGDFLVRRPGTGADWLRVAALPAAAVNEDTAAGRIQENGIQRVLDVLHEQESQVFTHLVGDIDQVLAVPEGQDDCGYTSPRTKELLGPADNITYADWDFLSANRAKITEKWNEIFG